MLIVTGTVLVLLTWGVIAVILVAAGLPIEWLSSSGPMGWASVRRAAWWGLLAMAVFSYLANLVAPLASAGVASAGGLLLMVLAVVSVALVRRRGWVGGLTVSRPAVVIWVGLAVVVLYLAAAALGPVTNYDSGLYHLGAIRYAADYASIPGLANLYFPFGYGNAEFPLAALLGNGPWGADGFRLLNGLLLTLMAADLAIRFGGRRTGAGSYVLSVGAVAALVPMVALVDYWVTSPSQDSAVLAVTVVASAYLADSIAAQRSWVANASACGALVLMLVLLRPTMAAYAVATIAVLVVVRVRRGAESSPKWVPAAATVVFAALMAGLAATARDYVLSGWLQYPLSVLPFNVAWRAPDPVNDRIATLGYHRDPSDLWNAAKGWGWMGPWFSRLPSQWETYAVACLVLAAVVAAIVGARWGRPVRWRALALCIAPSALMTAFWWLATPPSFRFAWGPVFTCLTIPIGWMLWRLPRGARSAARNPWRLLTAVGVSLPIVVLTLYCAAVRMPWSSMTSERTWALGVPYAVAPVRPSETSQVTLPTGLVILVPTQGEQCWTAFPMCAPRTSQALVFRDPDVGIQAGLIQ